MTTDTIHQSTWRRWFVVGAVVAAVGLALVARSTGANEARVTVPEPTAIDQVGSASDRGDAADTTPPPMELPVAVLTMSAAERLRESLPQGEPWPDPVVTSGELVSAPEISDEGRRYLEALTGIGELNGYETLERVGYEGADVTLPSGDHLFVGVQPLWAIRTPGSHLRPDARPMPFAGFEGAVEISEAAIGMVAYDATVLTPDHQLRVVVSSPPLSEVPLDETEAERLVDDVVERLAGHLAQLP